MRGSTGNYLIETISRLGGVPILPKTRDASLVSATNPYFCLDTSKCSSGSLVKWFIRTNTLALSKFLTQELFRLIELVRRI